MFGSYFLVFFLSNLIGFVPSFVSWLGFWTKTSCKCCSLACFWPFGSVSGQSFLKFVSDPGRTASFINSGDGTVTPSSCHVTRRLKGPTKINNPHVYQFMVPKNIISPLFTNLGNLSRFGSQLFSRTKATMAELKSKDEQLGWSLREIPKSQKFWRFGWAEIQIGQAELNDYQSMFVCQRLQVWETDWRDPWPLGRDLNYPKLGAFEFPAFPLKITRQHLFEVLLYQPFRSQGKVVIMFSAGLHVFFASSFHRQQRQDGDLLAKSSSPSSNRWRQTKRMSNWAAWHRLFQMTNWPTGQVVSTWTHRPLALDCLGLSLQGIVDVDNTACADVCQAHDVQCMPTLALVEARTHCIPQCLVIFGGSLLSASLNMSLSGWQDRRQNGRGGQSQVG